MDRLLHGEIPAGGKCDVKTLAIEAGITRAALYSTYLHLKEEFEARRDRMRADGQIPDPRVAQIQRLKTDVAQLRTRVAARENTIAELDAFRTVALGRLAAQHDEIVRLRRALSAALARPSNVRALRTDRDRGTLTPPQEHGPGH